MKLPAERTLKIGEFHDCQRCAGAAEHVPGLQRQRDVLARHRRRRCYPWGGQALEQLSTIAASVPAAPQVNPLEEMVREMLKPMLKQWLDEHLPQMVDEHVKREITRITGRPL